jgi:hypothetical protein
MRWNSKAKHGYNCSVQVRAVECVAGIIDRVLRRNLKVVRGIGEQPRFQFPRGVGTRPHPT